PCHVVLVSPLSCVSGTMRHRSCWPARPVGSKPRTHRCHEALWRVPGYREHKFSTLERQTSAREEIGAWRNVSTSSAGTVPVKRSAIGEAGTSGNWLKATV